jgi:anti-sigma B factor antagonist
MNMRVEETGDGGGGSAIVISIDGRIDTVGVERLQGPFASQIDAAAAAGRSVLLDLRATSFLSSMGVRLLIASARKLRGAGRKLVLFGATPVVQGTLDMVALDQIVPVVGTRAEALSVAGTRAS